MQAIKVKTKKLFIRQPFTQTTIGERSIIESVLDIIKLSAEEVERERFEILTGNKACSSSDFISYWEESTGLNFTPTSFRNYRIDLINQSDAFINIRTNISESSAFEIAYNVYKKKSPMFFAIWDKAPIKTTLLRDLDGLCDVTYVTFSKPDELNESLNKFLQEIALGGAFTEIV